MYFFLNFHDFLNFLTQLNAEIEQVGERFSSVEKDVGELNTQTVQGKLEKLIGVFKISALQSEAKKYDELLSNSAKLAFPEQQVKA